MADEATSNEATSKDKEVKAEKPEKAEKAEKDKDEGDADEEDEDEDVIEQTADMSSGSIIKQGYLLKRSHNIQVRIIS